MTTNPSSHPWLRTAVFRRLLLAAFAMLSLAFAPTTPGQTAANAAITGRVFNPVTKEYVRNAEVRIQGTDLSTITDSAGYYRLPNAPAGTVNLTVNYTGYEPATAQLQVAGGSTVTHNFELKSSGVREDVITLSAFTVSTEREGNAKAIMDQKAAMNVKTVVASDTYGEIAEGNIGEFLKFMPGLTLDYVETDTRAARMGGMEARYGAVTLDGNSVANAGSNSRQFEFEAMSINNIEAIEVNKTLSADMPADSPAGSINLRTKSALDRKGQQFNFTVGFIGNQYEHSFRQTPRHDDGKHAKSRPAYSFDYTNTFFDKLGIAVTGSHSSVFKPQHRHSLSYDYNSATAQARRAPLITQLNFKDGTKMTTKDSLGLKVDYQPFGPELRFTLTSSYTKFDDIIFNRNFGFQHGAAQNGADSTLTHIVANQAAGTRVIHSGGNGNKQIDTSELGLRFEYKGRNFVLDGQAAYSRARLQNGSDHMDSVGNSDMQLTNIGWTADRPSVDSPEWTITQTAGPSWNDLNNYQLHSTIAGGRTRTKTQQFTEQVNLRYNLPLGRPTFLKAGLYHQVMTRAGDRKNQYTYNWIGPNGSAALSPAPISPADFRIAQAFGGNIASLPVPNKTRLYDLIFSNPEYFTQTDAQRANDLDAILSGNQSVEEDVKAAYLMGNTRFGALQLQGGFRFEKTETLAQSMRRIPDAENPFPANTINRILYRWSSGRETREGSYDDLMPSLGATYRFSDNLLLKAGYHKAIKRPPLDQLAGLWTVDEANQQISVANPNLKPERSQKFSALLEYYFEPAGTAGIHIFQADLENSAERSDWLPASEFGYGDDPIYGGYEFRGWQNIPGTRTIKGIELNYTQQLTFFRNEFLRGTRVFATYSRFTSSPRPDGFVPAAASGGVSFRWRGFNAKIAGTWRPKVWTGNNTVTSTNNTYFFPGDREAQKERYVFDIDLGYALTRRLEIFASARNAFNAPITWYYPDSDGRIRQMEKFGAQWYVGVKGRF